jgi:hypothetical protein
MTFSRKSSFLRHIVNLFFPGTNLPEKRKEVTNFNFHV